MQAKTDVAPNDVNQITLTLRTKLAAAQKTEQIKFEFVEVPNRRPFECQCE